MEMLLALVNPKIGSLSGLIRPSDLYSNELPFFNETSNTMDFFSAQIDVLYSVLLLYVLLAHKLHISELNRRLL